MPPRRFTLTFDDGTVFHCAAFDYEAEREALLGGRHSTTATNEAAPPAAESPLSSEPRRVGRPSFDDAIAVAITELGKQLRGRLSIAARARLIQRHIALTAPDAASVPSSHTVGIYLGKSLGNSKRRKIAAGG